MKKYSKLIIITVVMVVTWIVFYVHLQSITDTFARFSFKTIEGDEALIDKIVVKGDTSSSQLTYEPFVLTKDDTTYLREASITERFGYFYTSEKIKQLQKEYRQFMRGKNYNVKSYGITEDNIYYAEFTFANFGINPEKIMIEVFDRETEESKQVIIDAPELHTYAYIEKVIPSGDNVFIVVENIISNHTDDTHQVEWQVYRYDFASETAHEPSKFDIGEIYAYNNFMQVLVDDDRNPSEIVITASIIDYEEGVHEDYFQYGTEEEAMDHEIVRLVDVKKFNLETKEISTIKIESQELGLPVAYNGEEIVFLDKNVGELKYSTYHLETNILAERITVPVDNDYFSYWDFHNTIEENNYVYTLLNTELSNTIWLYVIDSNTVELAYKGVIENVNEESINGIDLMVYFNEIEILE